MKIVLFKGVGTAIATPFGSNGVNLSAFKKLLDFQLSNSVDSIIVCGTTGEAATMSDDEKSSVIRCAVDFVADRVPVIAGCGSNNTNKAISNAKLAESLGVDGLLIVTPYYNKCTQSGLISHYSKIAESVSIPIILYNVPSRTGVNIEPETCLELSKIPNIVAIKEASGNLMIASEIKRLMPGEDFMVYSGDDGLTLPMLSVGACGVVSVVSHVAGKDMNAMIQAYESGHNHEALRIHQNLADIIKAMFITTNPIPVKYAARKIGLPAGVFNLPMCEPSAEEAAYIDKALAEYVK